MVAQPETITHSNGHYEALFKVAAVGLARAAPDGRFLEVNRHLCSITGYSADEMLGMNFQQMTHPDDLAEDLDNASKVLSGSLDSYTMDKRYIRKSGETVWITLRVALVRNAEGDPDYFISVIEDITARKAAEQAVLESEARLRRLLDQLFTFVAVLSTDGRLLHVNAAPLRVAGLQLDDVLGKHFTETYWWSYDHVIQEQLQRSMMRAASGETVRYDVPARIGEGRLMHIDFQIAPMRDADGNIVGLIPSGIDIDDRKSAEQRNELLIAELNHRVKNSLAVVQHIARQSFREVAQAEGAMQTFERRLVALASAQTLLTDGGWRPTLLADIVRRIIVTAGVEEARFHIQGPEVHFPPRTAVSMALAIHELSTNAMKYGALSSDVGRVLITWTVDDVLPSRFSIYWEERNGPRVVEPQRRGFGLRMVERALAVEIEGTVEMRFPPDGLICRIEGTVPKVGGGS